MCRPDSVIFAVIFALAEVKAKGWMALVKELGYSDATKFILLYEPGKGNYTKERKELFKDITIEEIIRGIKKSRESQC